MNDIILAKVDKAKVLLSECKNAGEAKRVSDMAHAAEIYAKRQKASQETIDYAHGVKVDAMTLLGEFLEKQDKRGPQHSKGGGSNGSKRELLPSAPPTLKESGIDKKEASMAQKLAKMAREEPEKHAAIRSAQMPIQSVFSSAHVSHNSGENEWYTPKEFISAAREVLGAIDLDPASSHEANGTVGAAKFYTKADDGLNKPWAGKVWMNPPYAGELIGRFTFKLVSHFEAVEVTEAIALVNNGTETRWFQELARASSAICFPSSRIKFWSPGKFTAAPLQGQAILYLGAKLHKFDESFSRFGLVCHVVR